MIIWRSVNIDNFGTKNVMLFYRDSAGKLFGTSDVIYNEALLRQVLSEGSGKIAILPGIATPVITLGSVAANLDFSKPYKVIADNLNTVTTEAEAEQKMQDLINMFTKFFKDSTKLFCYGMKFQYDWEKESKIDEALQIDAIDIDPDFRQNTVDGLEKLNSVFSVSLTTVSPSENYTHSQEKPEDFLFIAIPSVIRSQEEGIMDFLPKMEEVCIPYTDELAYTPEYKRLSKSLVELVEGRPENNRWELYDNEKTYYAALDEWVRINQREYYGNEGDILDSLSEEYFNWLMAVVYIWHWRHVPTVPDEIDLSGGVEDSESTSSFVFHQEIEKSMNAVILLQEFVKEVALTKGYTVYLQTVIQLLRWGDRKPTAIVFEDYDRWFSLGKGVTQIKKKDLSTYSEVNRSVAGIIYEDTKPKDPSLGNGWSFPVGLVISRKMQSSDGDEETVLYFYHAIDVITLLKNNEFNVQGIQWDGTNLSIPDNLEKITVTELVEMYKKSSDNLLANPFYRSQELIDFLLNLKVSSKTIPTCLLTIVNSRLIDPALSRHLDDADFVNDQELINLVSNGKITNKLAGAELGVLRHIMPYYKAMSETSGTWNDWVRVLQNFTGVSDWYGKPRVRTMNAFGGAASQKAPTVQHSTQPQPASVQPTPVQPVSQPQPTPMQAAPVQPAPVQAPTHSQQINTLTDLGTRWIKAIPSNAKLNPVVFEGQVICAVYIERTTFKNGKPGTRFTLTTEQAPTPGEASLPFSRIISLILHTIHKELEGMIIMQVFFSSSTTLDNLKTLIMKLSKQSMTTANNSVVPRNS